MPVAQQKRRRDTTQTNTQAQPCNIQEKKTKRLFGDDHLEKKMKHTGTNIGAMARMMERPDIGHFVQAATLKFVQDMALSVADQARIPSVRLAITVGVYCKWGKHRSIAFAELLLFALMLLGCTVEAEHLSKRSW